MRPLVSVITVTYGHERFLAQAVESVRAQNTDFPVEILISEDCSRDRTREIALGLQQRYPDTVRLFLSERNTNDNSVLTRAWAAAKGKYIAILDGDDYWTDPAKLQTQVDYLERHPDTFVCGHAVHVVDEAGRRRPTPACLQVPADRVLTREDLAAEFPFAASSLVFRNNGVRPPDEVMTAVFNADTFLIGYFANFGGGYMSRAVMGAYREHAGGVWSGLNHRQSTDYRNGTLSALPRHLTSRSLRAIAYGRLLAHSLWEDYSWRRRLRQIPVTVAMLLASLSPGAALYLGRRALRMSARSR